MGINLGTGTFQQMVGFDVPINTGFRRFTIRCHFAYKTRKEVEELQKQVNDLSDEGDNEVVQIMKDVLIKWDKFKDADGAEVEYNDENFESLMEISSAVKAIWQAYFNALAGEKSQKGNSKK